MSATAPGFHAPALIDTVAQPWMLTTCKDCGAPPHHLCRERRAKPGTFRILDLAHKARRVPESRELPDGWPIAYTDNGVKIVPGLAVLDYNRRETTVSANPPHESHGVWWFDTENGGMFDGSRLLAL